LDRILTELRQLLELGTVTIVGLEATIRTPTLPNGVGENLAKPTRHRLRMPVWQCCEQGTLAVGAGMTDLSGSQLRETVYKRFRVTEAVREPIAIDQWKIVPPATNSRQPLMLVFPRPLDWGLLSHTISVVSKGVQSIDGQIAIDQCEKRWSFTPTSPWVAGFYHVRVASGLEDVCGNSVIAAFDRPLRSRSDLAYEVANRSIGV
jgi:hypothetical protein